jgi:exodeoxyribonuclease-3
MKLASWNVNGLRAVGKKGFVEWLEAERPDVVGLQEIKCQVEQLDETLLHPLGYHSFFHSAVKPGYSGVALYCREEPLSTLTGIGKSEFDNEGRVLTAELESLFFVTAYFPNSQDDHARLPFKLSFNHTMVEFLASLRQKGKPVVLCGDFNVAHRDIDIFNPKGNINSAGFLPQERAWMDEFLGAGYRDLFREHCQEPNQYTWWSYMFKARQKNRGWRIDYFAGSPELPPTKACYHRTEVLGSDHCPIVLELFE